MTHYGLTVQPSTAAPFMLFDLYSPDGRYTADFLANYAYINLLDPLTRLYGIASVSIFGAGQYAMRFWVKPDQLAKLQFTVAEIVAAIEAQNTVNPSGQIGGEPVPKGQDYTYAVTAQGRLVSEQEFGEIVIRAQTNGSVVRLKDVARVELGAQLYNVQARLDGEAVSDCRTVSDSRSNAINAAEEAQKELMQAWRDRFHAGPREYKIALDTTLPITAGVHEIVKTLLEALALVMLIVAVFLFLQGWRAALIPLLAVPVALVGTFIPISCVWVLGQHSLLIRDGPRHWISRGRCHRARRGGGRAPYLEQGAFAEGRCHEGDGRRRQSCYGGGDRSGGGVHPHSDFVPGITEAPLYQQFAVTIAVSVAISAFNALSLSPGAGRSSCCLRPRTQGRGPMAHFFRLVQPCLRSCHGWICERLRRAHSQIWVRSDSTRRFRLPCCPGCRKDSLRVLAR